MPHISDEDVLLLERTLKGSAKRLILLAQELQAHERRCMSIASEVKKIARDLAPIEDGRGLRSLKADELRVLADAIEKGEEDEAE